MLFYRFEKIIQNADKKIVNVKYEQSRNIQSKRRGSDK